MKNLFLAAFAALMLSATFAPMTYAGPTGPSDDAGRGPTVDGGLNGGGG
jgi:hypothetical protein